MKDLTITVPCYNSEAYLARCLDSLVTGGEQVEIIVVDDGSTDRTGEIADIYREKYPEIVKVIHKENGGHGSGVNVGMKLASGRYFKVVDSDDCLEQDAYRKVLQQLAAWKNETEIPDLVICNYIYHQMQEDSDRVMHYRNVFPERKLFTWEEMGKFYPSQYLIMHALLYKTEVLRNSGVHLPEHLFYVDNIFANYPLPYTEKLYYMDVDLYQYNLGREDQSVNEKILIRRIDQQIRVTKMVAQCVELNEVKTRHPRLAAYLYRNVSIMMAISSIHLLLSGGKEGIEKHRRLWMELKQENPSLYYHLRYRNLSGLTNLPGGIGKKVSIQGYRIAKKIYKFQ